MNTQGQDPNQLAMAAPERDRPIESAIKELSGRIADIETAIDQLRKEVSPALSPMQENTNEMMDSPATHIPSLLASEMTGMINEQTRRVSVLIDEVYDMTRRCEL